MHGGTLVATSEGVGCGSTFTLRLPRGADPTADGGPVGDEPVTAARRVLVVDDNVDAAESLGMLLSAMGAEVAVEEDGPRALARFPTFRPEIVLLDIGMPGMDGYEVARRLRATPGGSEVLLVALTGWGQEEDRRRARDAGFDRHLIKPADLEALKELLNTRSG
ncbi:MAG: response regulator [Myxococcota bacterium]